MMQVDPQQIADTDELVYQTVEEIQEPEKLLEQIVDTTELAGDAYLPDAVIKKVGPSKLKAMIDKRPDLFPFFQLMRLLQSGPFHDAAGKVPKIRLKPVLSLSFQKGQVESVTFPTEENGLDYIEVTTYLPGLYGAGSPLPTFYTEELIEQDADDKRTGKDVFDVLNHRLYGLLSAGRNKYRLMERGLEGGDDRFVDQLFGLVGLREKELKALIPDPRRLARYLGLFSLKNRPAAGLQAMLSDVLGKLPVRIIQAVEHTGKIPIDQRAILGERMRLGEQANIGQEVKSSTGSIRIEIGPVSGQDYYRFFPGTEDYNRVVSLTRLYLSAPISFDVDIILAPDTKMSGVELGGELGARMGLDSWLGEDENAIRTEERRVRFSPVKI